MSKILVVDDAAFVRMQYKRCLLDFGYEVEEAVDGADALEKYQSLKPDGVLLDINMPVMDGLATLYKIMNIDPAARVAMVTCVGSQSIVLTALQTGAKDFVMKPVGNEGLINAVQRLVS
jgi:two-component system chemotaxis response regulator CheY